jgi:hypothetical protein
MVIYVLRPSEKLNCWICLNNSLGKFMTDHNQTGLDDHHLTTVHHSFDFDPLLTGEMD